MASPVSGSQDIVLGAPGPQGSTGEVVSYTVRPVGLQASRYDPAERRQSTRKQRERGVWVYIPAEEMMKADRSVFDPPPKYRVWGRRGGTVLVRLYKGGDDE